MLRRALRLNGDVAILTCFFNPEPDDRVFKLPPPRGATQLLLDSADPAAPEHKLDTDTVTVRARSVVLTRSILVGLPP